LKKLLGTLLISLAILGGIIGYAKYTGLDKELLGGSEIVTPDIIPVATPSPEPLRPQKINRDEDEKAEESKAYTENVVEQEETEWNEEVESELEETPTDEVTHEGAGQFLYAYDQLTDDGKELYDILYDATVNFKDKVPVPTLDLDAIDTIFNCVMMDHPEIFYVNGYRVVKYTQAGVLKRLCFTPSICYSKDQVDQIAPVLESQCNEILSHVDANASDYDKIKFIYDVIVLNTEYDLNSSDNQNVISVLINGRSVCQGYAKTMQMLLNKLGIPCTLVTGTVDTGERHAWNAIKADGEWYYTDVTWGDSSYQAMDASQSDFIPDVNYDYLLVPSSEINTTHFSDNEVQLPTANSVNDNYYVKEGLYITSYDPNQLSAIFDYQRSLGRATVALKCSDWNVYEQMYNELINNQHIFEYVKTGQIRYQNDDSMRKLVFALQ